MCEYKFKFPLLNGGQVAGANNAGIATFGSLASLARECAQNSLDAKASDNHPAKLTFKFHEIPMSEIPGVSDLKCAFERCREFWPRFRKDSDQQQETNEYKFISRALTCFENDNISVLEISDYNTTGLKGGDDDMEEAWYALVMSAGVCTKGFDEGGGFGIGKSAPFAVSSWRTVFYSSLTQQNEYAFRGVCYNLTHLDPDLGEKTQGIGYYGRINKNSNIDSLRDFNEIPSIFRRKEPGTSIFVLAFKKDTDSQEQLKKAVLESFWPAIYFEKICFDINGEDISRANLDSHMNQDEKLKQFMQCLYSPSHFYKKEMVGKLGECELFFSLLTKGTLQEVVCTRASRMKIQSANNFRSIDTGFVGLFSCLSKEGNRILKNMEPPTHEKWDKDRSNDGDITLSIDDRSKILKKLNKWIRDKINDQIVHDYADETDLEDVARYFNESSTNSGSNAGGENNHDGFSSTVKNIKVSKILTGKQKHLSSTPTDAGDVEEDDGILPRPPHPRPPHPTPPPPPHPNPVPNPVPNPDDIDKKTGNIPKH